MSELISLKAFAASVQWFPLQIALARRILLMNFVRFTILYAFIWDARMHWTSFFVLCLCTTPLSSNIMQQQQYYHSRRNIKPIGWLHTEEWEESVQWKLLISFNESLWNIFIMKYLSLSLYTKSLMRKWLQKFSSDYVMRYIDERESKGEYE